MVVSVIYIDTSVLMRACLVDAPGHDAAWQLLTGSSEPLVSSELLWLEADRAAIRLAQENPALADLPKQVTHALAKVDMLPLTRTIINDARLIPQVVKSLDAVHIASAESLGSSLSYVATADQTMLSVLEKRGLPTHM